jgi:hypothetical protein
VYNSARLGKLNQTSMNGWRVPFTWINKRPMLISSIDCSPIMSADQPHLVGTVDELQEASVVTHDAASGIVTATSPSDDIGNALTSRGVFGVPNHRAFGDGVDADGSKFAACCLYFRSKARTIATRACSIEREARAGEPITSPAE